MRQSYKSAINVMTLLLMAFLFLSGPLLADAKDTLTYVMGGEPPGLDPPNITDTLSATVIRHIYDLPIHTTVEGDLVPGLFTKWVPSQDGKTWTFHLRKGVSFSDGTPFNAEAVKYNWERCTAKKPKVRRRSYFKLWARNINIIDDHTIQVTSKKPYPPLERILTHNSMAFVSPAALKKYGKQIMRNPVGTGPFRLAEWIAGERLVLERKDDFWGPKPRLKRIVFKFVKESGSRVMMLETGEADLVLKIPPADVKRLNDNRDVKVFVKPTNRVIGLECNNTDPFLKDVRFRRALAYAIDKNTIIKYVMKGLANECCSPIAGTTFGAAKPKCYEYNPQKAKALLKEVGYNGEKLKLWTPKGRYTLDMETAQAVMNYWTQVGINVEFRVMELARLLRERRLPAGKVKYQTLLIGIGTTSGDGDQTLRGQYHSSNIPRMNRTRYRNPEYDKLAMAQATEMDKTKRVEFMRQCQDVLARDIPYIPLYNISQVVGIRSNLKGVEILRRERTFVRNAYFE